MSADCGVERDGAGLARVAAVLADVDRAVEAEPGADRARREVQSLTRVGAAIAAAAIARTESRGAHSRSDFPASDRAWAGRVVTADGRTVGFAPLAQQPTREPAP
jgi:L-aspartate oxidase